MPVTPTYPGVYIEEVPSEVRTITGVATSISAFIGRALRGPVDDPTTIHSFADYQRIFGGLWVKSTMSYAVQQFFLNGGSEALIVRVHVPAPPTQAIAELGVFKLVALVPGASGNDLQATVDYDYDYNVTPFNPQLFNLKIYKYGSPVLLETWWVTVDSTQGNYVTNALLASTRVRVLDGSMDTDPAAGPAETTVDNPPYSFTGGLDAAIASTASLNGWTLVAANPGAWGNDLEAVVDWQTKNTDDTKLFNLSIDEKDKDTGEVKTSESFRNVSVDTDSKRFVNAVLEEDSKLVAKPGTTPASRPAEATFTFSGGSNGDPITDAQIVGGDDDTFEDDKLGLWALEKADLFNILCIPPLTPYQDGSAILPDETVTLTPALTYCQKRRAMLLIDPPDSWNDAAGAGSGVSSLDSLRDKNSALFFPNLKAKDPLREYRVQEFAPCGAAAGIFARTDGERGVWKAPAGQDAVVRGATGLAYKMTDAENGDLNQLAVNCLRTFPVIGSVVWGARTLAGADQLASEWKYIPVRRTALYIEESLYRGTQWVVFEPNDEPLWSQIRMNVGTFMHGLFRKGAFQGMTPREAYFVKCDKETTTQADIDLGIVNILVGFAPLKPAEFVIIKISQIAGQTQA